MFRTVEVLEFGIVCVGESFTSSKAAPFGGIKRLGLGEGRPFAPDGTGTLHIARSLASFARRA